MLFHLKIHTFCLVKHPYKQTNVNYIALLSQIINTRYLSFFQIEKIFCPKFLLFNLNIGSKHIEISFADR